MHDPAAAFQGLVEPHLARLALVLRRRGASVLGADQDEDDLVQTVLVTAWRLFPEFEDRGPASTWRWLLALGEGAIADRAKYRKAKGRDGVRHLESYPLAGGEKKSDTGAGGEGIPAAVGTSITRLVARREERARVEAAIGSLEPGQRDVVVRHMLEGETLADIARAQGVSKNAVWQRLHRGMDRLRVALEAVA